MHSKSSYPVHHLGWGGRIGVGRGSITIGGRRDGEGVVVGFGNEEGVMVKERDRFGDAEWVGSGRGVSPGFGGSEEVENRDGDVCG